MTDSIASPVSTRDALIIELLSDVGRLHDDIKAIPKMLKLSLKDSLDIVADAVEDAEDTAYLLRDSTKEIIQATASKAGIDVGIELSAAIHKSLEKVFEPALNRASVKVDSLEARVSALTGSVRDTHALRFNYIMLAGFVFISVIMLLALGWIAIKAQDAEETNKWFYQEYKAQRQIIDSLPPELKRKFTN